MFTACITIRFYPPVPPPTIYVTILSSTVNLKLSVPEHCPSLNYEYSCESRSSTYTHIYLNVYTYASDSGITTQRRLFCDFAGYHTTNQMNIHIISTICNGQYERSANKTISINRTGLLESVANCYL